jgi:GT2 family glycosyltransferase
LARVVRPGQFTASKLVFAHDPTLINSAGLQLLRDGRGLDRGYRQKDIGQFETEEPVFGGCGAALAIDTHLLDGTLFDSRLFMYYEDLDLAWRGQLVGIPTIYAPRALVRHVHGGTEGFESPRFRFHCERNRALISLRNGDLFLAVWNSLGLAARVARSGFRVLMGRERLPMLRATLAAFLDFLRLAPVMLVERYTTRTEARCAS